MFSAGHMEDSIRQYEIPPPGISISLGKKLVLFVAFFCFVVVFRWALEGLFHWPPDPFPRTLFLPLGLAGWYAFRPPLWNSRGGSLVIGEDFIEGHTYAHWFTFKKRIYRDRIKSISENKLGLCVMDRGAFAARMLGFVFVPARLPQYEEIKARLAQWAPSKVLN